MVKITNPDDEFNYTTPQQVTVTSETLDRNSYSSHKRFYYFFKLLFILICFFFYFLIKENLFVVLFNSATK